MTPILTLPRWPDAEARQYFFWRHPEWWSALISSSAWAVLASHGWGHAGHEVYHRISFVQEIAYWIFMAAAMMLPLVLYSVWLTAIGSLWPRRHRAVAGFLAGFFVPWLGLGVIIAALREFSPAHTYLAAFLGFVGAAWWQRTDLHRRALVACHRTMPLAPVGWRADRDCLRFGGTIGSACLCSCWPLMLACALAGHSLIAMAAGGFIGISERHWFGLSRRTAWVAILAIAGYYMVRATWELRMFLHT